MKKIRREMHRLLQQALFDYQRMQYNTVVSAAMKMLNALEGAKARPRRGALLREGVRILLRTLYPIAPHITHVLWVELGFGKRVRRPAGCADAAAGRGGAAAGRAGAGRAGERQAAWQSDGSRRGGRGERSRPPRWRDEQVQKFVEGKPVRKVILVQGQTDQHRGLTELNETVSGSLR